MDSYIRELEETITKRENLALVKKIAKEYFVKHGDEDSYRFAMEAWQSSYYQVQEIAVFLCAQVSSKSDEAFLFLKKEVVKHENWRVQETLAMAFDIYCKSIGYENSLNTIREWMQCPCDKNRRAVSEGLRTWTSKPFFKDHPEIAIALLASMKEDESLYVRKSVGNALRDISKKHKELIEQEVSTWDLTEKKVLQTYKLAHKYIEQEKMR